ncbi:MAG: ferredoxin [Armatimonadota bacterium]
MAEEPKKMTRREFLPESIRGAGLLAATGLLGSLVTRRETDDMLWQLDPHKCVACENCATACVLSPSAVKCVQEYEMCGYCEICFAYVIDQRTDDIMAAENQRCPTGAIVRTFVEEPYYQYVIDEPKCIGCGKCIVGCRAFGNDSLLLQVRHDRCVNCNQCNIATVCPADAFVRVPADDPYLLRTKK